MYKIPEKYNTFNFSDLADAWKDLIAVADGTSEKELYSLAANVLRKIKKPVTKENMDIIIRTVSSQIKVEIKDKEKVFTKEQKFIIFGLN